MNPPSKTKRIAYGTIAGLGLFAGAFGIASAQTTPAPTTPTSVAGAPATNGTAEQPDVTIKSSVTIAPDKSGTEQSDAAEAAQLKSVAKISDADANAAATAKVPGTVVKTELSEEDGNVVYDVEVKDASGAITEVVVDAGNGTVLAQEVEGADDAKDANESNDANDAKDAKDANEAPDAGTTGTAGATSTSGGTTTTK